MQRCHRKNSGRLPRESHCFFSDLHLYGECNLPLWATEDLLSCHSAESGKRTFRLKRKAAAVVELFSGKTVVEHTAEFDYEFDGPETVLFQRLPEE